jgi:hypothetical protein
MQAWSLQLTIKQRLHISVTQMLSDNQYDNLVTYMCLTVIVNPKQWCLTSH